MWTQSKSVTDRQTDRYTTTKTALCIASRGKNELNSNKKAVLS